MSLLCRRSESDVAGADFVFTDDLVVAITVVVAQIFSAVTDILVAMVVAEAAKGNGSRLASASVIRAAL